MPELKRANVFEPRYGRRQIETRALTCLERCRKKLALDDVPVPIPVEEWIEGPLGIRFGVTDLSHLGEDVLGAAFVKEREILIDERVTQHEGRCRFTCAHELGHLTLHAKARDVFHETEAEGPGSPSKLEREADRFAAAFLVPLPLLERELARPQDWSTKAIDELRQKLASSREHFTVEALQRAHALHYHKALVEVISMVKHAAREEEPLLTAAERVDRALRKMAPQPVVAGTWLEEFSEDQRRWLARIRAHLIENLSIDREDFDDVPIFSREGGWVVADGAFSGRLTDLLTTLNAAIAA